jgi:serine/threonine-protein kinase
MHDLTESVREALAGRLRVRRRIGSGAMATVFLAEPWGGGSPVAVKVLRPEIAIVLGPDRFQREIAILAKLNHPRIVPILETGAAGRLPYFVTRYVAGGNLRDRLTPLGWLSLTEAVTIARDVADALDYAHREGVLHRDIKPENILLGVHGALLCDFGLARAIDRASVDSSSSGLALGTPAYMSPEQAMARKDLGPSTDVYALACVTYEMLAGVRPFDGPTAQAVLARQVALAPPSIRTVRPEVPKRLEETVLGALAKEPKDRPRSAGELARQLEEGAATGRP